MASSAQALPPPAERPLLGVSRKHDRRRLVILAVVVIAAMALVFLVGFFFHHKRVRAAEEAAEKARSTLPAVNAVAPRRSTATSHLLLPGTISQRLYVGQEWRLDIGHLGFLH